jgi:hypothetical protein
MFSMVILAKYRLGLAELGHWARKCRKDEFQVTWLLCFDA